MGGHRQSRLAPLESMLRAWIAADVDMTLAEICVRLQAHGTTIKTSALWQQLNKWGLSLKKNAARRRARAR
jgi:transposase